MSFEDSGKKPVSAGPWGGDDGVPFDDGVYSTVRQVIITYGSAIDSIQIEYDQKGSSVWSEKHGGRGGNKTDKVKLDYPDEFLTSFHGYYGKIAEWGPALVRSLTFKSNRKTYGPFGVEQGTCFSFPMSGGKIVGFHGKAGWYLDSIGVHLKPLPKQNDQNRTAIQHPQNYISNGTENMNGFSLIQGSIGQSYDIVLAVRQREELGSKTLPNKLSRQDSGNSSSSSDETKGKKVKEKQKVKLAGRDKVSSRVDGVAVYGPWGGSGGSTFDEGASTGIKQITVSRSVGIVYIKVLYDRNGESVWGSRLGGTGGFRTDKVIFDYPNEILTHITGSFGPAIYMGPHVIKSLTFHTTKGRHGPFGEEQGTAFSSKLKEGKIVGFHGKKGLFLDAIGVHVIEGKVVTPTADSNLSRALVPVNNESSISEIDHPQWSNKLVLAKRGGAEEVVCGVVKEPAPCGPGPWGGDGGRPWDDGVYSGIKQIYLTRSTEAICSIQIEYDRNGQSVWSIKHGGNGGTTTHRIKLEYPHEVLTCISGYYGGIGREEKPMVIKSLTFYTSRGKYGPFGEEIGIFFTSTITEGKVVGFHGRSSFYLDAIGIHMQHWLGNQKTSKSSLFKIF
ncbi:hypothetical protein UlMin_034174 [Ulmus minor]